MAIGIHRNDELPIHVEFRSAGGASVPELLPVFENGGVEISKGKLVFILAQVRGGLRSFVK
ncbi:hypothetical protein D3C84_1210650 [compost metagenome]